MYIVCRVSLKYIYHKKKNSKKNCKQRLKIEIEERLFLFLFAIRGNRDVVNVVVVGGGVVQCRRPRQLEAESPHVLTIDGISGGCEEAGYWALRTGWCCRGGQDWRRRGVVKGGDGGIGCCDGVLGGGAFSHVLGRVGGGSLGVGGGGGCGSSTVVSVWFRRLSSESAPSLFTQSLHFIRMLGF